ncbi:hypothetical protein [Chitiniphilus shinanonensis]|uniref:hypothetical protein n=1 Tax=Chitiniphilus shinanonensis TaxID=553088 RepID=UPI003021CAF0
MFKKFCTRPGSEPLRLALTTGHIAVITDQFEPLHERFHAEAYGLGCISEDMLDVLKQLSPEAPAGGQPPARDRLIADALSALIERGNPDDFTGQGLPRVEALSEIAGFPVTAGERDAAMALLEA